jgi:hypothetical protein
VLHVNVAAWFGTQPFSCHTSPGVEQVPPEARGTQAPATQTRLALAQSFVTVQAWAMPEQTPVVRLQVAPSRHPALLVQLSTHLPATQLSPLSHCDWSKHWFAAAVHVPPWPFVPEMQIEPLAQFESVSHAGPPVQVPVALHV